MAWKSIVSLLALAVWCGIVFGDDGTLIQTTFGTIQCFVQTTGELRKDPVARNCLGIPFAAPPLGDLRFSPPVPPQSWSGVRNATKYSPACMQTPNGLAWTETGPEPLSEDCLYLNVFAPLNTVTPPPEGFPVMVFLYGGCWEYGSAAFPFYHGDYFEGYSDKVILVTVNYRLGAFGFLASQALQAQSPDGSTGNYGVQDQRMALYWVRDNIAAFGGNPNNVLLFGQSAGSGSTAFHVVAKRSAGLFHRAIFESGPYAGWSSLNMTVSETHYQAMVRQLGCTSNGNGAQQVACLRSKSAEDILNNYADGSIFTNGCSWAPVVDGVELDAPSQYLAQTGQFNRVPVMLGTTTNEGSTFVISCDATEEEYWAWCNETGGPDLGTLVYNRYPSSEYGSPFWAASMVMTDACMACPARRTARWLTYPPRKDTQPGVDVYLYHFEHAPDVTQVDKCLGVFHGAELPFVFYDKPFLDVRERDFGKQMATWWQTFAANGNPNFNGAPIVWPKYDIYSDQNAGLSLHSTIETNLKQDNCDWWDALFVANTWLC